MVQEHPEQEVGGLLFGHVYTAAERRIVQIDWYENVDSEHLRGPAYVLSELDRKRLDQSLSRLRPSDAGTPVGFFRSHLRKGIYLDKADFSLFQAHFSGPYDVFLVARRDKDAPPTAGFFFWEDSRVRRQSTYVQFPLDVDKLEQGGFAIERTASPVVASVPPVSAGIPALASDAPNSGPSPANGIRAKKVIYAALGAVLIVTSLVCAALLRLGGGPQQQSTPVSLTVERSGGILKLNWDPNSSAVRHANHAVLWITDGGKQRRVDLPADRLHIGSFTYPPETPDVNFRLDLLKVDTEGSESVRYVAERNAAPLPGAQPVASQPPAQRIATLFSQPSPASTTKHSPFEEEPSRSARSTLTSKRPLEQHADRNIPPAEPASRAVAAAPQQSQPPLKQQPGAQVASLPPQQSPPPQVAQNRTQQQSAAQPTQPQVSPQQYIAPQHTQFDATRSRVRMEPTVVITTRPEPPPKYQEWIAKVPIVRTFQKKLYKAGGAFTPPRPSREVTPHLPPRLAGQMPGEWRVDLRLNVDPDGFVHGVDLLSFESDPRLVSIAASAMRQWRFQPGMLRDHPVSCDVLATLRFRNPPADGVMAQR